MTDEEVMYRAIERWRDGDKDGAILLVRNFFGDTANKTDTKMTDDFIDAATLDAHIAAQPKDWMEVIMTDDERALLLATAKAVYKHFSTGPHLIPNDQRPSADDMIAMIRKLDPTFDYDWRKILKDNKPTYRWYSPASW